MMTIGDVARASGVSAKMIRYYESVGLLMPAPRTASGYRTYGPTDLHTLRFIRRARSLGFSMEQTSELLGLWRDTNRASSDVKAMATEHVRALEARVAELTAMTRTLRHLATHCHGDGRPNCPILDDLSGAVAADEAPRRSSPIAPDGRSRRAYRAGAA